MFFFRSPGADPREPSIWGVHGSRLDLCFRGSKQGARRAGATPHGPSPSVLSVAKFPLAVQSSAEEFLPQITPEAAPLRQRLPKKHPCSDFSFGISCNANAITPGAGASFIYVRAVILHQLWPPTDTYSPQGLENPRVTFILKKKIRNLKIPQKSEKW